MDLNIDSLLNLSFDDKGFANLLQVYSDKIESELAAVDFDTSCQEKVKSNPEISHIAEYGEIIYDLDLVKRMKEICEVKIEVFDKISDIEQNLEAVEVRKDSFICPEMLELSVRFRDLLIQLCQTKIEETASNKETLTCLKSVFNKRVEELFSLFRKKTEALLSHIMKAIKFPLKKQNERLSINTEDEGDFIFGYFSCLIEITVVLTNLRNSTGLIDGAGKDDRLFLVEILFGPVRQSIAYHFLGKRQTNKLEKPEWMFTEIIELFELNLKTLKNLEIEGVHSHLSPQLVAYLGDTIKERFLDDWKGLKEEKLLLLNFFDQLEALESNFNHAVNGESEEKVDLPNIFQRLLELKEESLTLLLDAEKEIFRDKIFSAMRKGAFMINSKTSIKSFELFAIIENYCFLHKKFIKKYTTLSNAALGEKVRDVYEKQIFKTFLSELSSSLVATLAQSSQNNVLFLNCFWISLKYLRHYIKVNQCEILGGEELRMVNEFKIDIFLTEVKKVGERSAKKSLKSIMAFFNSREILDCFNKKQKIELEDANLKSKISSDFLLPIKMEFDNLIPKNCEPKFLNLLSKEISFYINDYIFQTVYGKYSFSEFGLEFLELCMKKLVGLIQDKFNSNYTGILEKYLIYS